MNVTLLRLGLFFCVLGALLHGQGAKGSAPQDASWLASASAELALAEYRFQAVQDEEGVSSASNRAQELRSRISARGLDVFPRTASADGEGAVWTLALATVRFGRVDGAFELAPPAVCVRGQRAELDHGPLVEWFENTPEGIEQGWTIAARPTGAEELWIGLEFHGELSLRIEEGARSAVLVDAGGEPRLRYRGLMAFDATGRALEARLGPGAEGVGIAIDDAGAVYPLLVDPVLTGPAWTAESNQFGSFMANSVASAGDVNDDGYSDVIVGAFFFTNDQTDEGRAFLYLGSAAGLSTSAAWTAESNRVGTQFGNMVGSAGDVNGDGYSDVLVGAPLFSNGQTNEGRAYLYLGSASGLSTGAAWTKEADRVNAYFGSSIAGAGDVNGDGYSDVLLGDLHFGNGQASEGRALLYLGSASGLSTSAAWTVESNQAAARLGVSVASAGDVNGDGYGDVLVGAPYFSNGHADEGRAFLYLGSASGPSTSAAWTAESDQANALFGYCVASAGDVNGDGYSDVLVSALGFDNGQTDEGRIFLYLGSALGLSTSAAWTAESNQADAGFGQSAVASAGDVNGDGYSDVLLGAFGFDNGQTGEGRAFLYLGSASGLSASAAWTAEGDQTDAWFGASVASAGDVNGDGHSDVIVGAMGYDNGQLDEGRAFVYHGSPSGLSPGSFWSAEGDQAGANFGLSVVGAGDVNGDGYGEVAVGAPFFDNGQNDEGAVFVYAGSATGTLASPSWSLEVNQAAAEFGHSVARAGDVNGDGYGDLIVGARLYDNGQTDEGRAFVFHGSSSGLLTLPSWSDENDQAFASFGASVASAGDVNGDGYGDVLVGAPDCDNGLTDEGCAYVYHGSPSGLSSGSSWSADGNQASANFGLSVSGAGDVNADGYADVIVGAYLHDNGHMNEGSAYAYLGSRTGLASTPVWQTESDSTQAAYGRTVAAGGDLNGDSYSDVLVAAYTLTDDQFNEGRVYAYMGGSAGLSTSPLWTADGNQAGAFFGQALASAGDVNGDGYGDVVVGAPGYGDGQTNEGRGYVYLGSATGPAASPDWTVESDQAFALLGGSAASAGDVNGDGYGDVIFGAVGYDGDLSDEGRAWIWLGNAGHGGLVRELQQRTRAGTRPISVVGSMGESGLFRIRCDFHKNAAGFAWAASASPEAWLEWEVKPLGIPFDGSGVQQGDAQSLVPAGGMLTFDELASIDDATGHVRTTQARSYRWRARVATNSPLFPHTAWFSAQGSSINEAKLRKPKRESP